MRIVSAAIDGDILGAVKLPYRGYTISLSNIFTPTDIAIFDPDDYFVSDGGEIVQFTGTVEGIVAAKELIDRLIEEG